MTGFNIATRRPPQWSSGRPRQGSKLWRGTGTRLTCIIPYKSCPLFALCSHPTNCRLCPSTFLILGRVLFHPPACPPARPPRRFFLSFSFFFSFLPCLAVDNHTLGLFGASSALRGFEESRGLAPLTNVKIQDNSRPIKKNFCICKYELKCRRFLVADLFTLSKFVTGNGTTGVLVPSQCPSFHKRFFFFKYPKKTYFYDTEFTECKLT